MNNILVCFERDARPHSITMWFHRLTAVPGLFLYVMGLGYQTDKNQRSLVIFCMDARPDHCVYGHGRRLMRFFRRMLMRLTLSAMARTAVGIPLVSLIGSGL